MLELWKDDDGPNSLTFKSWSIKKYSPSVDRVRGDQILVRVYLETKLSLKLFEKGLYGKNEKFETIAM